MFQSLEDRRRAATPNLLAVLLVALLALTFAASVSADTPELSGLPSSYWGTVTINGESVGQAVTITAWIDASPVATTTTRMSGGESVYVLDVPGDEGDLIRFRAGSAPAGSTIGNSECLVGGRYAGRSPTSHCRGDDGHVPRHGPEWYLD